MGALDGARDEWNAMCAACHNTRLRKNYEPATDSYQTAMAERSVGCESCHGPMKAHADWQAQYPGRKGDPSVKKQTPDQILDTCAGCHSRRSELTGDFCPTDNFFDHYAPAVVDETDLYYADGQVRDEVYVYSSFRSSRMFHAGVRCLDCHDPHSNKPILPGNQLCMRCHTAGGYPNSPPIDPAAHTFHLPESAGSQCVNCHMPHTTYMGRHPRRDHGFTIPDPLLTKELGIPNACNRCHQDQDADWALAAVEKWYGDRMERRTRERARWIADAREGKPSAKPNMVKMLEGVEGDAAYWRASAAALLERWVHEPDVVEVLARFLGDADPLVRAQAALSLAPAVEAGRAPEAAAKLRALLDDPIRMVRVNAAWALRESVSLSSAAAKDLRRYLDHNTDQPTGALQLGVFLLARNQVPEAIAFIGKAVEWDPLSAPLRHEYAVALSMMGRIPEAVTQLEKAVELAPEEAEFQFKLSLAYNEMRNLPKVIEALRKTVEIDPNHSRAWYNLGLALNQIGDPEGAINALAKAESTNPEDPGPPYAAATIHFRLGNIGEARAAAQRAVTIAPDFEEARQLLFQLSVE
ncbi:MAG: ammonia-forming cytochrome c nitrite reductase subunit c552 [Verrucomicrobiales bacterium]